MRWPAKLLLIFTGLILLLGSGCQSAPRPARSAAPVRPPGPTSAAARPFSAAPLSSRSALTPPANPANQNTPLPRTRLSPPPYRAPAPNATTSRLTTPIAATAPDRNRPAPDVVSAAYVLKPQDVIVVTLRGIPNEQEISDVIDESGAINLPLIGRITAAGRTASQLELQIEQAYLNQQYYRQINAIVVVPSQSYYVQGEVKLPGRYPIISGVTVMQAIATAGGYTEFANPKKTQITRAGKVFYLNLRLVERDPNKDMSVESGDVIVVPRSVF